MREILKKVVDKTTEMLKSANLAKVIFYWNMPSSGVYTQGFNEKNEKVEFNFVVLNNDLVSTFFIFIKELNEENKINKGTLTIYPNGEYESSFIWDEEAHLSYLGGTMEGWLEGSFRLSIDRIYDIGMFSMVGDSEVKIIVSFTKGISNPVLFIPENNPEMIFKMYLEQIFWFPEYGGYSKETFEAYAKERDINSVLVSPDTKKYFLMNEGELKGRYPRWNVASLTIKANSKVRFEDIKFEWREDLA